MPQWIRIFAESLIHEIGVAAHEIRSNNRPLAKAERFDEQGEADGDFFAPGHAETCNGWRGKPVTPSTVSCAAAGEAFAASRIISPAMQPEAFRFMGALPRCCDAEHLLRGT